MLVKSGNPEDKFSKYSFDSHLKKIENFFFNFFKQLIATIFVFKTES